MQKINWDLIWNKFDLWFEKSVRESKCETCGRMWPEPDWEEQKRKIKELVEKNKMR